jgi:hypothetical protein
MFRAAARRASGVPVVSKLGDASGTSSARSPTSGSIRGLVRTARRSPLRDGGEIVRAACWRRSGGGAETLPRCCFPISRYPCGWRLPRLRSRSRFLACCSSRARRARASARQRPRAGCRDRARARSVRARGSAAPARATPPAAPEARGAGGRGREARSASGWSQSGRARCASTIAPRSSLGRAMPRGASPAPDPRRPAPSRCGRARADPAARLLPGARRRPGAGAGRLRPLPAARARGAHRLLPCLA